MPLPHDVQTPRDLLDHLHQLAASAGEGPFTLTEALTALTTELQNAVSGYAGVSLTVVRHGQPVVVTAVRDSQVELAATSLGLPLVLLSPTFEDGGRAVLYSTTPGSLVDLAADLRHVLSPGAAPHALTPELDADLPPARTSSRIDGLTEMATVNRAVGVLLEQGHDPDSGLDLLRRQALAEGIPVHTVATQLLEAQHAPPRGAGQATGT